MIPRHGIPALSSRVPFGPLVVGFLALSFAGCGGTEGEADEGTETAIQETETAIQGTETAIQETEVITLGPRDGHDLPATDLERVAVGTLAPDFSLQTITGDTLTLSDFRGAKDVVLVFYRGHW